MVLKDLFTLFLQPPPPLIFGTFLSCLTKKRISGNVWQESRSPAATLQINKSRELFRKQPRRKCRFRHGEVAETKRCEGNWRKRINPWRLYEKTNGFLWFVGTHVAKKSLAEEFHPYPFEDLKNLHVSMFFWGVERMWKNPGGTWTKIPKPCRFVWDYLFICQRVAFVDFSGIVHVDYPETPSNQFLLVVSIGWFQIIR